MTNRERLCKMPIFVQTFENILSGDKPDLVRTMVAFTIGSKTEMHRKALAAAVLAWRAIKIEPTTAIIMHFGGYDDDPRELWQIPEVCRFVQKFCAKTKAHEHPQVEPQSRDWLLACGADPSRPVKVQSISQRESLARSAEFFKQVIKEDR
jgi:hypothetical protein